MLGLVILGALLSVFLFAMAKQHKAEGEMANTRAAIRLAEETLLRYETTPAEPREADARVKMQWLAEPSPVAGRGWLQVTAEIGGKKANLVGLAFKPANDRKETEHADK
jgi:hypothetical protein